MFYYYFLKGQQEESEVFFPSPGTQIIFLDMLVPTSVASRQHV